MTNDPEANRWRPLSRREMLKVVSLGSSALVLAACGAQTTPATGDPAGSSAETTATEVPANAETTEAPPAAEEEPAAVEADPPPEPTVGIAEMGQGSQQLTFWHGLGGADGATLVPMLQQYASDNPEIALRSETYDWAIFYQKLPTATAAGTPPDMAIQHEFSILQMADQGILQDADALFYQPGLIPKEDFNPNIIKTVTYEGKTMCVPFDNHGWGLFVNKQVIEEAGLDPANLPKNGIEFLEWAQKVTVDEAGKHPNETGFDPDRIKVFAIHPSWVRFTMPSTLWQFGGGVLTDDGTKSILGSEQSIAAGKYWHDLMYKYHVAPPAIPGQQGAYDYFKGNGLALMWDGSWSLNFFKDNPDVEKVTRNDLLNSLAPDGKQAAKVGSHMLVIPVGVEEPNLAAAKGLITWLSDNGEAWAQSGQLPARLSVQNSPAVQEIWTAPAFVKEFTEIGKTEVPHKAINEIVTIYETAWGAAMANTTPVEQALQEASTAIQAVIDRG